MASGVNISITGMDKVLKSLDALGPELIKDVDREFSDSAREIKTRAQIAAPTNTGQAGLRGSITDRKTATGRYEVTVGKQYAPFMEFGTKGKFKATTGFENYASEFRGLKVVGPNISPLDALTQWVKDKGIAKGKNTRSVAFLIYRSIKKYGVKPHPFLLPAFVAVRDRLVRNISDLVKNAVKR